MKWLEKLEAVQVRYARRPTDSNRADFKLELELNADRLIRLAKFTSRYEHEVMKAVHAEVKALLYGGSL